MASIKIEMRRVKMSFGEFGGQYVPQELKVKLNEIEMVFNEAKEDSLFIE